MSKRFRCPTHQTRQSGPCTQCVAAFQSRRHRDDMTGDERVEELDRITDCVTIPVSDVLTRVNELVGRPVYTHEIGLAFEALKDEARTNNHAGQGRLS